MAKAIYKPLLFTTTLRNPERMKDFLKVIASYEGQVLTNDVIDNIVFDLVSKKIYVPMYATRNPILKNKLLKSDSDFDKTETNEIILNSPQKHKEAGFDSGWPSRFDTWYKFFKELGFLYYKMNERIRLSESGHKLILATQEGYAHLETQVFLNAFVKYHRVNPYLKVLNNNKPLILLLQSIIELEKRLGDNSKGIAVSEIPLFICWKDNNYKELVDKILEIRGKFGYNPSNEVIYDVCKEILNLEDKDEKRFKIDNITHEMPDDFIRKMRLTGIITIRGMGSFVDVNKLEIAKVNYILNKYSDLEIFTDEQNYFEYMSTIDYELVSTEKVIKPSNQEKYNLFLNWVNEFDLLTLKEELLILRKAKAPSKHAIFKYIDAPLRLEFLTALILQKQFTNIVVNANYTIDDEGLPTSFATGGTPDIVCKDQLGNVLFEVTMLVGSLQCIREMNAITRHLQEILKNESDSFSVILAPTIHEDTIRFSQFIKFQNNIDIIPLDILKFVNTIDDISNIRCYKSI